MRGWRRRVAPRVATLACVLSVWTVVGCIQDSAAPGPFSGPSELGLSLTLTASPDVLPLDGAAQSTIGVLARDEDGQTVSNLRLRLQIGTATGFADYGALSTREVMTGGNGRAAATYTAPLQFTSSGGAPDTGEVVTIWVTPVGDDYGNAVARAVTIRLLPAGTVIPPFSATVGFAFTPDAPVAFTDVLFTTACVDETDANCVRDPLGLVTSYRWSFGDGGSATGATAGHRFDEAGTYLVTLTIEDANGRSAQVTRSVAVTGGVLPTAVITFSPTEPTANETIFFNATLSTAAPGRTLVSQRWDFGDGTRAGGIRETHAYAAAGTYVVTLTVTDDAGQQASAIKNVEVAP